MVLKKDNSAQAQYRAVLKAYLTTKDIELILGFKSSKASQIMLELQDYVISTGKKPIGRLISSQIFIEYFGLSLENFKQRAIAEKNFNDSSQPYNETEFLQ